MNEYPGQQITIGAIVGLAIGGGLIFLALVGIGIYCVIKHRRKRLSKEREAGSTNAGSTVYSSSKDKYYNDSKVHIGRDFKPSKRSPPSRTFSQNSQSDRSKEPDIFIVKDQYGKHPATFKNDAFVPDNSSENPKRQSLERSKEYPVYDNYDRARHSRDSKPQSVKSEEFKRADPKRQSAGKGRRYPASNDDAETSSFDKQPVATGDVRRDTSKRQPSDRGSYRQEKNTKSQSSKYDEYDYPHGTYSRMEDRHSGKYEEYDFSLERESRPRNRSTRDNRYSTKDGGSLPRRSHSGSSRKGGGSVPRRSHSPYRDNSYSRQHPVIETRPSSGNVRRQTPERSSSRDRDSVSRKGKQPKTLGDLNINARYGNRGQIPKR